MHYDIKRTSAFVLIISFFLLRKFFSKKWGKAPGGHVGILSVFNREGMLIVWLTAILLQILGFADFLRMRFDEFTLDLFSALGLVYAIVGLIGMIAVRVERGSTWGRVGDHPATQHRLITTGPYKILRHPHYAFLGFYAVGIPLLIGNWAWTLIIPWVILSTINACKEERDLEVRYGDEWRRYASTVLFFWLPKSPFMAPLRPWDLGGRD